MVGTMTRIISVASGKGGVGKTSFSINLAFSLSSLGNRVCLVDADLGLANVDVLLDLYPEFTLDNIIFDNTSLQETLLSIDENLDILPGGSGITSLADLSSEERNKLVQRLQRLQEYEYILIDNSPGITAGVISFCLATKELILVISPEVTSIADGYALLKSLRENGLNLPPFLIINKVNTKKEAQRILNKLNTASKKFLGLSFLFLGIIPEDPCFKAELEHNCPVVDLYPHNPASQCFNNIANRLHSRPHKEQFRSSIQEFWEKTLNQFKNRLQSKESHKKSTPPAKTNENKEPPSKNIEEQIRTMKETIHTLLSLSNSQLTNYIERISPLDNFYGDLSNLLKRMETQLPQNVPACRRNVGIISNDEDMKKLIHDVLASHGFNPLDLNNRPEKTKESDLIIYNFERFLDNGNQLKILDSENKIPVIFLLGIYYYNNPPVFLEKKTEKKLIPVPFNIKTLFNAINDLIVDS